MFFRGFLECLQANSEVVLRHYRLLPHPGLHHVPSALPQKEGISDMIRTREIPQPSCTFGVETFFDTMQGIEFWLSYNLTVI